MLILAAETVLSLDSSSTGLKTVKQLSARIMTSQPGLSYSARLTLAEKVCSEKAFSFLKGESYLDSSESSEHFSVKDDQAFVLEHKAYSLSIDCML